MRVTCSQVSLATQIMQCRRTACWHAVGCLNRNKGSKDKCSKLEPWPDFPRNFRGGVSSAFCTGSATAHKREGGGQRGCSSNPARQPNTVSFREPHPSDTVRQTTFGCFGEFSAGFRSKAEEFLLSTLEPLTARLALHNRGGNEAKRSTALRLRFQDDPQ